MPLVCNYSLIRVVPNRTTGQFVNIGVVLSCPQERYFDFRLEMKHRHRLQRFFPGAALDSAYFALSNLERELDVHKQTWSPATRGRRDDDNEKRLTDFMRHLARPREALIQYGPLSTILTESPEMALDSIFDRDVARYFSVDFAPDQLHSSKFEEDSITKNMRLAEKSVARVIQASDEGVQGKTGETPLAIKPVYSTPKANHALPLYEGFLVLEQGDKKADCEGTIAFSWLPSPAVTFHISENGPQAGVIGTMAQGGETAQIHLQGADGSIRTTNTNYRIGPEDQPVELDGFIEDGLEVGHGENLQYVIFHLVNFIELIEQPIKYDDSRSSPAWASVEFDEWHLTIDTVENYKSLKESLKQERGSGITHAAKLERLDGKPFSSRQALEIQSALFWFLSFARGFESPVILPIGFNFLGDRVWESWRAMRTTSWCETRGWLSGRQYVSQSLEGALQGFWKRWNDPLWNDPLSKNTPLILAIHWFLSANNNAGGIEGSIILAQTGLELMAWVLLVEVNGVYAPQQFRTFDTAEKFRRLMNHLGVDVDIPARLPNLPALAVSREWADGPTVITDFRDAMIHPDIRVQNRDVEFMQTYEILELALWYLELSILHVLGYNGRYLNRTRLYGVLGDTELVPWASSG